MSRFAESLARLEGARLLVLGDVMLDRYTWGDAERVSPEAPVLVLRAVEQEVRLGGSASVARLATGLGGRVSIVGVVGDDSEGVAVKQLLAEAAIDHRGLLIDPQRKTTTKERFIGRADNRHPHHILRVDKESVTPVDNNLEDRLIDAVEAGLKDCQALLISDYAKGICTADLLAALIGAARARSLPVIIDPARIDDYERYRGATILTPNRVEAETATGITIRPPRDALNVGQLLCERLGLEAALVTLDHDGIAMVRANGDSSVFATRSRAVYDVTGAGDMVLAMVGAATAAGLSLDDAVRLANAAAGLEVERVGIGAVTLEEILAEMGSSPRVNSSRKQVSLAHMATLREGYRAVGKRVVFANGCFDLLHAGHVQHLEEAAGLGNVLVVAINSDASVRQLKGADRPVVPQSERATLLSALACVDHVLVFDDDTPYELIRAIRPDILVKGGTCDVHEIVGRDLVASYGGRVCVTAVLDGVSTTRRVDAIQGRGFH